MNHLTTENNGRFKAELLIALFSLICWGRILTMSGIWWDDWAWVWYYFGSDSTAEFMRPFEWLKHKSVGYMLLLNFKLFHIFREYTTNLWSLLRFTVFTLNAIIIYRIARSILRDKDIIPLALAVIYVSSPVVNHLALVTHNYHVFLFFYLISILLSVKSVAAGKIMSPYYLLAILFSFFSMISLESFVFFDVLRFLLFFVIIRRSGEVFSTALKRSFIAWLPFVLTGTIILVEALIVPQQGPYAGVYSAGRFSLDFIYTVIERYYVSMKYIFIKIYSLTYKHALIREREMTSVFISLAAAVYAFYLFKSIVRESSLKDTAHRPVREPGQVALFGLLTVIIGLLPYALTREAVTYGHQSRHGLLAAIGASIFFPAVLITFHHNKLLGKRTCQSIFALLVFFGVLQCNYTIKTYKDNWEHQRSIWWQMVWRAPDIRPNTFMVIDMPWNEAPGGGSYVLPPGLNLAYAKSGDKKEIFSHYAYELRNAFRTDETNYRGIYEKEVVEFQTYRGLTRIYPRNLIAASYQDEYLYLNDEIAEPVSSDWKDVEFMKSLVTEDRIIYDDAVSNFPYRWILGPEPEHDWRYYYQKANALSGSNDAAGIVRLFNESRENGYDLGSIRPQNLLPFIKAFYLTGDPDTGGRLLTKWAASPSVSRDRAIKYLTSQNIDVVSDLNEEIVTGIDSAFIDRQ
ncbi:MAG: hypothetical protein C4581_01665 [Nitrospiraceae bacterium]|nr:MAG: hypothetical protein C4581_01665 [Nitrospiraceae bacterium]